MRPARILFTAHAPVHYVCFRPVHERLLREPGIEVWFSGELEVPGGRARDAAALYRPFRIPPDRILELPAMRRRSFDLVVCCHTHGYFPSRRCPRVQMFHGLSFRNVAVRKDQLAYDYFFILGPYMRRLFARRRLLPAGDPRALEIGFPKVDRLVDGSLDRKEILDRLGLRGDRPVVLYAPTGQKNNSLETMGEEVIRSVRRWDGCDLLVKPHDHPKRAIPWFSRLRPLAGRHVRLIRDFDIVPYLFVADLLITDASSASSEYSILDRPMVFLDVPALLAAARRKGTPVDLQTFGRKGGITVRKPSQVPRVVDWFLRHPGYRSSARRAAAASLFYEPGRATDRAVAALLGILRRCNRCA